jgi:hypothetical protein
MVLVGHFATLEDAIRARDCAALHAANPTLNKSAGHYTLGEVIMVVSGLTTLINQGAG